MFSFYHNTYENKNKNFNNWLLKEVEPNKLNKEVVHELLSEINIMLDAYGYKIKNPKQFKNELASYMYRES
tara:strand:+ start:752 stop:964 length:213 start_codon:yes stop_codon:yes gene_type:complete